MPTYAQQGSGIPGVQGVAAVAPPTQFDSLDAIGRLQQAFKSGFMDSSEIMDNLIVKPSERKARVAVNTDAEGAALANMEARPANTRRRIAEDVFGAATAEEGLGMLPEMTAVKRGTLRNQLESTGLTTLEQANARAELLTKADLIPLQADIARAESEEKRVLAQGRLAMVEQTLGSLQNRMKADAAQAAALADDPEGLKTFYGKVLAESGALTKPVSDHSIEELSVMVAEANQRKFDRAREMLRLEKAKPLSEVGGGLRKEFDDLPEVKAFRQVQTAFGKLQAAASKPPEQATAQDDMAAIFSYMKILDPGSTVREGEYTTAANSGGWPTALKLKYDNAVAFLSGERKDYHLLDPDVRRNFVESGKTAYIGQARTFANALDRHVKLAKDAGVSLDAFLGPNDLRFIGASSDETKLGPDVAAPTPAEKPTTRPRLYNFPARNGRPARQALGIPDPTNPGRILALDEQ